MHTASRPNSFLNPACALGDGSILHLAQSDFYKTVAALYEPFTAFVDGDGSADRAECEPKKTRVELGGMDHRDGGRLKDPIAACDLYDPLKDVWHEIQTFPSRGWDMPL